RPDLRGACRRHAAHLRAGDGAADGAALLPVLTRRRRPAHDRLAMLIASKLIPSGAGLAPVLLRRAATIELDWDTRQKSRFDATDSQGRQIGVFLPRGTAVRGGDVL